MSHPYVSHYKIVIAGNIVEVFQYAHGVGYQLKADKKQRPHYARKPPDQQQISPSSLSRTRQRVVRTINANCHTWTDWQGVPIKPQFLTYTFKENITDLSEANPLFTNYIKRLNYHEFNSKRSLVKYVSVPEFQKRGAVHYHVVFFNLRSINQRHEFETGDFASLWEYGFIKVKKIAEVPNIGNYMTKYMTKDATDRRLVGRKKYFATRGLHQPIIITHEHLARDMNDYLATFKPIHAYITKPKPDSPYPIDNPTFSAVYHLSPYELQGLKNFYSLDTYASFPLLP
jgi:hypothetical protein